MRSNSGDRDVLFECCGNGRLLSRLHVLLGEEAETARSCRSRLWRTLGLGSTNAPPDRGTVTCGAGNGHFDLGLTPYWSGWLRVGGFRAGGVVAQVLPFARQVVGEGRGRFGFRFLAVAFSFVW